MSSHLTIGALIRMYVPDHARLPAVAEWAPDVFAVCAAILQRTDAYVLGFARPYGDPHPCGEVFPRSYRKDIRASGVAKEWREAMVALGTRRQKKPSPEAATNKRVPRLVRAMWRSLLDDKCFGAIPVARLQDDRESADVFWAIACLLRLLTLADEASAGMGINLPNPKSPIDPLFAFATYRLTVSDSRSLTFRVPPDRLRVLPKQHCPQRGWTLRSLSHHLALMPALSVDAQWTPPFPMKDPGRRDSFRILVLPWPFEVRADAFKHVDASSDAPPHGIKRHRHFTYQPPSSPGQVVRAVNDALLEANQRCPKVDIVVMPELALPEAVVPRVWDEVARHGAALITGVAGRQENYASFDFSPFYEDPNAGRARAAFHQHKHHRWCLDRGQIVRYGLEGQLHAARDCWEDMRFRKRQLRVFTLASWLTVCTLICEDLARQEPVAEVVRAIGPNLVFALLLDGPQVARRWGSLYAGVLVDDPGSSVLTVTSLGMAKRAKRAPGSADDSHVVAMWRDVDSGAQEIRLGEGHRAALLHVACRTKKEWSADGRHDNDQAHFPVLVGHETF